jgi:phage repressor protein C with HTH and peptisase S24 domain
MAPSGKNRFVSAMNLEWLKAELEKHGRSQSALARFMGFEHAAIVNRLVNGKRRIKVEEAEMIHDYLRQTESGDARPIPSNDKMPQGERRNNNGKLIPVHGVVEAGAWREVFNYAAMTPSEIPVANTHDFDGDVFAYLVSGNSMDRHYPPGSYVIVRSHDAPLMNGKRFVIERDRDGLVETTIKEAVRVGDDKWELWPRSNDERHQAPIPYAGESVTLRILGRVIASLNIEN